jgi:E3 ubiquitin-protein ligase CCNP1IP1
VLAGLAPPVIMDICSRALSFWTYQATQEVLYQETKLKNIEEKYIEIQKHLGNVMNQANNELEGVNLLHLYRDLPSILFSQQ